jgi:hypothetical protein
MGQKTEELVVVAKWFLQRMGDNKDKQKNWRNQFEEIYPIKKSQLKKQQRTMSIDFYSILWQMDVIKLLSTADSYCMSKT